MANLKTGSVITTPTTAYIVKDILGEGTFGQVALCRKTCNREIVALKVMKLKEDIENALREKEVLRMLHSRGAEDYNIVRLNDSFNYRGHYCLEFEHLDINLYEFLQRSCRLSLKEIRPILHQLMSAMMFLKNMCIIHGDVKPENVMMVDHKSSLQVKLIDFGLAQAKWEAIPGTEIQTGWYRAPEVFLGSRYDESVDMWSLGCMAVELLLGKALFPGNNEADMVRHIVKTVGFPSERVLQTGKYSEYYFEQRTIRGTPVWRLKSSKNNRERTLNRLEDLYIMERYLNKDCTREREFDLEFFVDLVTQLLNVHPQGRISAASALEHPFISMRHMVGIFETQHVNHCVEVMRHATGRPAMQHSVNRVEASTSSCLQGAPKASTRQRDKEPETSQQNKPDMFTQPRKISPFPEVLLFPVNKMTFSRDSQDVSLSRKRRRNDKADPAAQLSKIVAFGTENGNATPKRVPVMLKSNRTTGSKKRSREPEKDTTQLRPTSTPKRHKGTPYNQSKDTRASSSSTNTESALSGSRKRSRGDDHSKQTRETSALKKLRMSTERAPAECMSSASTSQSSKKRSRNEENEEAGLSTSVKKQRPSH